MSKISAAEINIPGNHIFLGNRDRSQFLPDIEVRYVEADDLRGLRGDPGQDLAHVL